MSGIGLAVAVAAATSGQASAAKVVVNEFFRSGTFASDEWVELLVTEDLTAAELEGYFVGDSTSATASKQSGYHLANLADFAPVFYAGTLLVVGSGAGTVTAYDPASGAWLLALPTSDPHVVSNGTTGDFASEDLVYVDLDGTKGDATLSAQGFSVSWDVSPGAFAAIASVTIPAVPNAAGAQLSGAPANAASAGSWAVAPASGPSPGAPNAFTANAAAIDDLRCADDDGDGFCRFDDVCPGGDDALDADGDGAPDDCDACPVDALDDVDGDGVCDSADACPGGDDSLDADGDGAPDACDACPVDALDDRDGDGVCDSADACPGFDDRADADGDGAPDACDACPVDPLDDTDRDGVCDSADACPGYDDAFDVDGDGSPDACDVCPVDALDDTDGDGVCDSDDTCPGFDDGIDSDGDGVCDGFDVCPAGDDGIDSDGDGVPDACEAVFALSVGPVSAGQPVTLEVTGLEPGEFAFVFVGGAQGGVGPCYAGLGGVCLDLGRHALWIGTALADATGAGSVTAVVPPQIAPGRTVRFQALVVRGPGGAASITTEPVARLAQ